MWLYTYRTCHAIRARRDDFIYWPDADIRDLLSEWYEGKDFPGCVGDGDAMYLRSEVKPEGPDGHVFFCHKGFFAVRPSSMVLSIRSMFSRLPVTLARSLLPMSLGASPGLFKTAKSSACPICGSTRSSTSVHMSISYSTKVRMLLRLALQSVCS